jgi:hypothetical protein
MPAFLNAARATATWRWQANYCGKHLAIQARLYSDDLAAVTKAAAAQVRADGKSAVALEQPLSVSEQTTTRK